MLTASLCQTPDVPDPIARIATLVGILANSRSGPSDPRELFLREGARALRGNVDFSAALARSHGDQIVIDVAVTNGSASFRRSSLFETDVPVPMESTFLAEVEQANRTLSWDDIARAKDVPGSDHLREF